MARKAIWRGVVVFAGIRVPVKLYSAVRERRVELHLLHDQDEVRLQQQMVCELEDKPVASDQQVKALEVDKDQFVLVEPQQLEELTPESDRNIEVGAFVPAEQVDGRYFERPYYLGPDGEEEKYASLAEALSKSGRFGICQWTFRKRSYAGCLRSREGLLELVSMRLADELLPTKELDLPAPKVSQRELSTAKYLIDELSGPFEPEQFHDDFQEAMEKLVATKARGGKVKTARPRKPKTTGGDELLKTLEASLSRARKGKGGRRAA